LLLGLLDDVALLAVVLSTLGALEDGFLISGSAALAILSASNESLGALSLGSYGVVSNALLSLHLVSLLANKSGLLLDLLNADILAFIAELEVFGAHRLGLIDLVLTGDSIAGLDATVLGLVIIVMLA